MRFDDGNFVEDNFFVIDSNNCHDVKGKLYGYVITENQFIRNLHEYNKEIANIEYGVYVNVLRKKNKIIIQQDYWGSYGLFLYRNQDYFALSNSFLYLANHLYKQNMLSLDKEYLSYFLFDELASLSFDRTAIAEIKQLRKNCIVYIDTVKKELKEIPIRQNELIYPLDSKESFEILDKWHNKFSNFFQQLIAVDQNINVNLSGGFDSRASFTVLAEQLNHLDKVNVFSLTTEKFKEDFEIANSIAEKYHFKLNNEQKKETINFTPSMAVLVSLLTKMCFHKQFYSKPQYLLKPLFSFSGMGGEALRAHWKKYENSFVDTRVNYARAFDKKYGEYVKMILNESFGIVRQYPGDLMNNFYRHTRLRSHFAKTAVEAMLKNTISVAPLLDPSLYQIDPQCSIDGNLFFSCIYQRYLSGIIDFKFENKRTIKEEIKKLGNTIQEKYARIPAESVGYSMVNAANCFPSINKAEVDVNEYYLQFFYTPQVQKITEKLFNIYIYNWAARLKEEKSYYSHGNASSLIAMAILDKMCTEKEFDCLHCLSALIKS